MDLFELFDLSGDGGGFAEAYISADIPWENPEDICDRCDEPMERRRTAGFTITFRPGSDVIPDFLSQRWGLIVTDRVKVAFEEAGLTGYRMLPVTIKGKPNRGKRRRWPIVTIPYEGPPLWDVYVTECVSLITEQSSLRSTGICEVCGRQGYETVGDADEMSFVVDRSTWNGSDFMSPREVSFFFVTERVVQVIKKSGFTNAEIWCRARMSD